MPKNTDWFPGTREKRLMMAKNWASVLSTKAPQWNIPAGAVQDLSAKITLCDGLFTQEQSSARTPVVTAQCKAAFDDLEAFMRDFKRRYYLVPPLTDADLISLDLKPSDEVPTPEQSPTAQAEGDLSFPGVHLVELKNIRPAGPGRIGDGVRVYFGLTGAPTDRYKFRLTEDPVSGNDLPYSQWVSKKKMLFDFDGESGNTIYFCLRYEINRGGNPGPFGPIMKAVIP